jgi:hypothetical protein
MTFLTIHAFPEMDDFLIAGHGMLADGSCQRDCTPEYRGVMAAVATAAGWLANAPVLF